MDDDKVMNILFILFNLQDWRNVVHIILHNHVHVIQDNSIRHSIWFHKCDVIQSYQIIGHIAIISTDYASWEHIHIVLITFDRGNPLPVQYGKQRS